jgi:hypothetical protein
MEWNGTRARKKKKHPFLLLINPKEGLQTVKSKRKKEKRSNTVSVEQGRRMGKKPG